MEKGGDTVKKPVIVLAVILVLGVPLYSQSGRPASTPPHGQIRVANGGGTGGKAGTILECLDQTLDEAVRLVTEMVRKFAAGPGKSNSSPFGNPNAPGDQVGTGDNKKDGGQDRMKTPENKQQGIRQYRSFNEALADPRIGTLDKLRIAMVAKEIKGTTDPAEVRRILADNGSLLERLRQKGIISAQDLEDVDARLREMEAKGETFDFAKVFELSP